MEACFSCFALFGDACWSMKTVQLDAQLLTCCGVHIQRCVADQNDSSNHLAFCDWIWVGSAAGFVTAARSCSHLHPLSQRSASTIKQQANLYKSMYGLPMVFVAGD
jgi:hypothetical protein